MSGVRMDDGGMLVGAARKATRPCALNAAHGIPHSNAPGRHSAALLDAGQKKLAAAEGLRDSTGEHFERLAGRFRRATREGLLVRGPQPHLHPRTRLQPNHGGADGEQLILTIAARLATAADQAAAKFLLSSRPSRARCIGRCAWSMRNMAQSKARSIARGWCRAARSTAMRAADCGSLCIRCWRSPRQHAVAGSSLTIAEGQPVGRHPDAFVSAEVHATLVPLSFEPLNHRRKLPPLAKYP